MSQDRVIVINGFSRGGTNILWNICQSSQDVVSSVYELGELVYPFEKYKYPRWAVRNTIEGSLRSMLSLQLPTQLRLFISRMIKRRVEKHKLKTLEYPNNKYKNPKKVYTQQEIEEAICCVKTVDEDIILNKYLEDAYNNPIFIGLVRHPYAVCEGWIRRGASLEEAITKYVSILKKICSQSERPNYLLLTFSEVLEDPWAVKNKICTLAGVQNKPGYIRLKSKRKITEKGDHKVTRGTLNQKYWFDKNELAEFIDPDINNKQGERLSHEERTRIKEATLDICIQVGFQEDSF